jgi:protein phosphatase
MAVDAALDAYRVGSAETEIILPIHQSIVGAIHNANTDIYEFSMTSVTGEALHRDPDRSNMGTTLTVAVFSRSELTIGHVGDSRAYLNRKSVLDLLTEDQTIAAEQARQGVISWDMLPDHPLRNVLIQAVGTTETVNPFVRTEHLQPGDAVLLCSDGLHEIVSDAVLQQMINESNDSQKVAESLVKKAIKDGSTDNVTALVVSVLC